MGGAIEGREKMKDERWLKRREKEGASLDKRRRGEEGSDERKEGRVGEGGGRVKL